MSNSGTEIPAIKWIIILDSINMFVFSVQTFLSPMQIQL